ncbi:class I SAM-dependent methyltransferase [Chitinophaga sp. YIM B06452]|uniref:class I SAM-dependent methyltransferase n=1 Tax=Chitinophaga sp. YIM B06452 TaxID=3082158 RepID=UPI0031FE5332
MKYLIHFLYVAWYWDLPLAFFIVKREIAGERRYGINTTGTDNLKGIMPAEDRVHITMYEPVNYFSAEWLMDRVTEEERQTGFLDVGCGKGRVLAIAAAYGFSSVTGIEISPRLCKAIPQGRYTVHCIDARYYDVPDHIGVIFLFNPFDETVMKAFIQKVMESLGRKGRPLKVLYANPRCRQLWLDAGFEETDSFVKMKYLQGSVLERKI